MEKNCFLASINVADGTFNITGHGVDGEGTFTISNGTAEIGLHMVVGQMVDKSKVVIALDKRPPVTSLRTTSNPDHTEMEIGFTKEGTVAAFFIFFFLILTSTISFEKLFTFTEDTLKPIFSNPETPANDNSRTFSQNDNQLSQPTLQLFLQSSFQILLISKIHRWLLSSLITLRAKLLNADWSMKRVFLLNLLCEGGKMTRSRLVLRLPSNSLFNQEVVFL